MTERVDADLSVGEELARERQEQGLSVADVAQQLKFAVRQIEALEQGRYQSLPAGTFARGMVRAYARLLKLDAEPLVDRVAPLVAAPDNTAAVVMVRRSIPIVDSTRRSNLTYAALSLAILGVIAAVAIEWRRERASAARMTFVPAAQAPIEPQRSTVASVVTPPNPASISIMAAAGGAEPHPAAAQPPRQAEGRRRIVMRFERESWVEVRGAGGRILTSELNRAGSERTVDGLPPFALVIGNAQHVRLSYDERPIDLAPHVKVEVARFTLE